MFNALKEKAAQQRSSCCSMTTAPAPTSPSPSPSSSQACICDVQEMLAERTSSRKRARANSSDGCNCGFALAELTQYTFKLLSMCAPESLRPLAAHNIQALCADDFCSVILPDWHEVERIVLRRLQLPVEAGTDGRVLKRPKTDEQNQVYGVDCDLYQEPEGAE